MFFSKKRMVKVALLLLCVLSIGLVGFFVVSSSGGDDEPVILTQQQEAIDFQIDTELCTQELQDSISNEIDTTSNQFSKAYFTMRLGDCYGGIPNDELSLETLSRSAEMFEELGLNDYVSIVGVKIQILQQRIDTENNSEEILNSRNVEEGYFDTDEELL